MMARVIAGIGAALILIVPGVWAAFDISGMPDITVAAHDEASLWVSAGADGIYLATCSEDGTVKVWKRDDLSLYKTIGTPAIDKRAAEFSPDGESMAEAGTDGKVNIRKIGKTAGFSLVKTLPAGTPDVTAMAMTADGSYLAVAGDSRIKLWRTKDYYLKEFSDPPDEIRSLSIGGDGHYLICATVSWKFYLYDIEAKRLVDEFYPEDYPATAAALSQDGQYLVHGGYTGTITFRSVPDLSIIRTVEAHSRYITACAVSADNKYFATASAAGDVKIWKMGTFGLLLTLRGQAGGVLHLSFTPDRKYLLSAGEDGTVQMWDLERLFGAARSEAARRAAAP